MTTRALRTPGEVLSLRVDVRMLLVCGGLAIAGAAAVALGTAYGAKLPVADVAATLLGGGDAASRFVVLELQLPRAAVAALAGAAFGLSGAVFQTFGRNALASPDIIGISSGAGLFGVTVFVLGGSPAVAPVAGFAGALTIAVLMYVLAWRGGLSTYRLVLVGIGLAALAEAGIAYVLTQGRVEDVQQAYTWLVGSVNLRNWEDFTPLVVALLVLLPVLAALGRSLDALALGDEPARALGVRVQRARLGLVAVGAALAAIGVAAAGPVVFVAFVAPLFARWLTGVQGAASLPAAALCGAALVPAADVVGRAAFTNADLPVGIVTAVIGAPVFLLLLHRSNRGRRIA